jgi:hypothetical protein
MDINKYWLTIILGVVLCSYNCGNNSNIKVEYRNSNKSKTVNFYNTRARIESKIDSFLRHDNIDQANNWLDTLIGFNKDVGYLYFERGYVETYDRKFNFAIKDFKVTEALKFDSTKCEAMIFFCKTMLHGHKYGAGE